MWPLVLQSVLFAFFHCFSLHICFFLPLNHVTQPVSLSRATAPPPLDLPEVGPANPDVAPSPSEETPEETSLAEDATTSSEKVENSPLAPPENAEPPSASLQPEPSSSPSPTPSPTPSPGQYAHASARSLNYFDAEESPWADARSSTPVSAAF